MEKVIIKVNSELRSGWNNKLKVYIYSHVYMGLSHGSQKVVGIAGQGEKNFFPIYNILFFPFLT